MLGLDINSASTTRLLVSELARKASSADTEVKAASPFSTINKQFTGFFRTKHVISIDRFNCSHAE